MQLIGPDIQDVTSEIEVLRRLLKMEDANILELGCGAAEKTRQIASAESVTHIVAAEVDSIQHEKNLAVDDLPDVTFKAYGAEQILEPDESFDIVLMFKSLHHVPLEKLDTALNEIHRVLKPGGVAYISEPVFDGAFNEIMRLFHDEQSVRQCAFDAVRSAVDRSLFDLEEEYFFRNAIRMQSWEQYETGILGVTHTNHNLSHETLAEVKRRFLAHETDQGFAFEIPNRVDLLRRK